nr:MAG TPA: hypothetical protein [Caudoviricetes sp.]
MECKTGAAYHKIRSYFWTQKGYLLILFEP